MFDELDKSAGLIGTVEYGIDEFLMNEEGDLWKRDEADPTLRRYVSAHLPCLHCTQLHLTSSRAGAPATMLLHFVRNSTHNFALICCM